MENGKRRIIKLTASLLYLVVFCFFIIAFCISSITTRPINIMNVDNAKFETVQALMNSLIYGHYDKDSFLVLACGTDFIVVPIGSKTEEMKMYDSMLFGDFVKDIRSKGKEIIKASNNVFLCAKAFPTHGSVMVVISKDDYDKFTHAIKEWSGCIIDKVGK